MYRDRPRSLLELTVAGQNIELVSLKEDDVVVLPLVHGVHPLHSGGEPVPEGAQHQGGGASQARGGQTPKV